MLSFASLSLSLSSLFYTHTHTYTHTDVHTYIHILSCFLLLLFFGTIYFSKDKIHWVKPIRIVMKSMGYASLRVRPQKIDAIQNGTFIFIDFLYPLFILHFHFFSLFLSLILCHELFN